MVECFFLAPLHCIDGALYRRLIFLWLSSLCQDDMQIRVFNYNTLERVHMFEAHSDYIRCIAVHPTQPFILTSSGESPLGCFHVQLFSASCFLCSEGLQVFLGRLKIP